MTGIFLLQRKFLITFTIRERALSWINSIEHQSTQATPNNNNWVCCDTLCLWHTWLLMTLHTNLSAFLAVVQSEICQYLSIHIYPDIINLFYILYNIITLISFVLKSRYVPSINIFYTSFPLFNAILIYLFCTSRMVQNEIMYLNSLLKMIQRNRCIIWVMPLELTSFIFGNGFPS